MLNISILKSSKTFLTNVWWQACEQQLSNASTPDHTVDSNGLDSNNLMDALPSKGDTHKCDTMSFKVHVAVLSDVQWSFSSYFKSSWFHMYTLKKTLLVTEQNISMKSNDSFSSYAKAPCQMFSKHDICQTYRKQIISRFHEIASIHWYPTMNITTAELQNHGDSKRDCDLSYFGYSQDKQTETAKLIKSRQPSFYIYGQGVVCHIVCDKIYVGCQMTNIHFSYSFFLDLFPK